MAAKNRSTEIQITRLYDSPVKAVWDAWTDPAQVAKWWGPRGFSITTHSKDLRSGGHWHYTMHGPDGTDYPNKTKYFEVEENSRLVYDHGGSDERAPLFRVTVVFSEIGEKTQMAMTMSLPTPEAAQETRQFIKKAGGNSTWDRLAEYLAAQSSGNETFVINRTFDAPIATVYEMWTNPEHIAKWLAPTGSEMVFLHADITAGGRTRYCMTDAGGRKLFGRAEYIALIKPLRIVYTQQICDEMGNLSRHPMAPSWPATMLTIVDLVAEGPDQTRVTVTWSVHGDATSEEMTTFVTSRGGMTGGWTGSFDKLESCLADICGAE